MLINSSKPNHVSSYVNICAICICGHVKKKTRKKKPRLAKYAVYSEASVADIELLHKSC